MQRGIIRAFLTSTILLVFGYALETRPKMFGGLLRGGDDEPSWEDVFQYLTVEFTSTRTQPLSCQQISDYRRHFILVLPARFRDTA